EAACYRPFRLDDRPEIELLDPKLLEAIQNSLFVVADLTQHKNGVYFEAGYAMALERKVIFACRADDFDMRHFDVSHYGMFKWETLGQLRSEVERRILHHLGKGPF